MDQEPLNSIKQEKEKPEDLYQPSAEESKIVGAVYQDFFRWRTFRSGAFKQFQNKSLDEVLTISRELFWNAVANPSEDLANIGLEFNIPFTRKEVNDFVGRLVSLGVKPRVGGDDLNQYAAKVLNGLYQRWRFKSNDKVEKFWQLMYGVINGTVCLYVGYNSQKKQQRILTSFDKEKGTFSFDKKNRMYWDDVEVVLVPLEDIYLSKIYERNVQKQGKLVWRTQMEPSDFHREFGMYPDHEYVLPGNRIAEDSLYYRLLGGTGVTTVNKVEVLRVFDTDNDQYIVVANGILLNKIGTREKFEVSPLPFNHKMMPFVWSVSEAVDEKLAYGMPLPFKVKDMHKMLNTEYVMLLEHQLRIVDKPYLSSDIESPDLIFGAKRVIPVTDVNAYKEISMDPIDNSYMTTMNSVQQMMSSHAQGGINQLVPSIQPKSAAEVDAVNQARQQAMGTPILMYYDMLRQEIMLILKTMLQFYSVKKYSREGENIVKAVVVPNMALSTGGVGNLEIRIVRKTSDPLDLHLEAIRKGAMNGKSTEIIEAPVDLIQELEFEIQDIELEPEKSGEMRKAVYSSSFLIPLLQNWGQTGLLDPAKSMIRFMEIFGEHPLDYVSEKALPSVMSTMSSMASFPSLPGAGVSRSTAGGALAQSGVGAGFGGMSAGGQGMVPQPQAQPSQM